MHASCSFSYKLTQNLYVQLYIIVHIDCLIMRRVAKMRISHTAAVWLGTPYDL